MGSFSWLKADDLTNVGNICEGAPFKCLIPAEFGGGFIKDHYQDYGYLGQKSDGSPKYDMYELLAFWNSDEEMLEDMEWEGKHEGEPAPMLKCIDDYTDHNRNLGIDIGCYDEDIMKLKYPLKLVSVSFNGTYEECEGRSYGDPNQGCGRLYRTSEEYESAMLRIEGARWESSHRKFLKDIPIIESGGK